MKTYTHKENKRISNFVFYHVKKSRVRTDNWGFSSLHAPQAMRNEIPENTDILSSQKSV